MVKSQILNRRNSEVQEQCPAFRGISFRDGIEVQSRDPGIFRDGISLIFQSRDCLEIVRDFSGLTFFDAISDYLE